MQVPSAFVGLSSRELEVLTALTTGSTNDEIARELGVSIHAVKFHLTSIYRKLGVANRTEAAVRFLGAVAAPPAPPAPADSS